MGKKFYIDKLYICNFKPFGYIEDGAKPYYEIDFSNEKSEKFSMIFSGPNGYGKSSIFQAIEFALIGDNTHENYADRVRSLKEHIYINNPNKPCFIALQLKKGAEYISIIRYAERGKTENKASKQREIEEFSTYILKSQFVYDEFRKSLSESENQPVNSLEEISTVLGEKDIKEWLRRSYIHQEQKNAVIEGGDTDRVNFLKNFIEEESKELFQQYDDEKKLLDDERKELESKIKTLKHELKPISDDIKGDKPACGKVIKNVDYIWDKEEYAENAMFHEYADAAKRTLDFVKNLKYYSNYRCQELIGNLSNKEAYFDEYIVALFDRDMVAKYKSDFEKKQYLLKLLTNEEDFWNISLNSSFLTQFLKK